MQREIYYIEDDAAIAGSVAAYLEEKGFRVTVFAGVSAAKQALLASRPDFVIADWNLPDGSGSGLCSWIRRRMGDELPVLLLTVRGETGDMLEGFQSGADDYLTKPFELEVLYARVQAILRRMKRAERTQLFCDEICLDREKQTVSRGGCEAALAPSEYRLLEYLLEQKGRTVTRSELLEKIWDSGGNFVNDNTLTVTMKRLRERLGNPACIKTIRSFGYRMEDTI
nr:response regulator transcription factor [uncultured Marvinbryantia sp.]